MALHYTDKTVDKWNVKNFIDYMADMHRELFHCEYAPFGSWAAERGRISKLFGTATKAGKYDKELVKQFVDETFKSYKPSQRYPGTSFGFMWTYRQQDFTRIQKEYLARKTDEKEIDAGVSDDVSDWFNS